MTSAYWLNAYSVAMWLLIVAANYFFLEYLVPVWFNLTAGMGRNVMLPVRIYAALGHAASQLGWLVLVLVIVALVLLRWRMKRVPDFLKSGRLQASVTWLVMAFTLAGVLAGLTDAMTVQTDYQADWALSLKQSHNELAAIESIRTLTAAEAAYKHKHPDLGYTCKLEELKPVALPLKFETYWLRGGNLFTGKSMGYQYSVRGCSGKPATAYQILAAPINAGTGRKRFCADNSGRFDASDSDNLETCLNKGSSLY